MSSTALRTLAVVMVVAAAILGFVAFQFSQGLTQSESTAQEQQQRRPRPGQDQVLAVVAVEKLPAYEPITREAVALVPISVEPPEYYTDISEVVGRTPLRTVQVGMPITPRAFGSANTLAQSIPPGTQAVAVEVSEVIGVGDYVQPGDVVDVLLYLRSSGQAVENSQARVLLRKVLVLAYREHLITVDSDGDGDSSTTRKHTAVLAVPTEKTTRLMLGASVGELRLALYGGEPVKPAEPMQVAANGTVAGDAGGPAMPPPVSPRAMDAGGASADDKPAAEQGQAGDRKADKDNNKIVTLEELAEIKEEQEDNDSGGSYNPPGTIIQVFQGAESTYIRRPY